MSSSFIFISGGKTLNNNSSNKYLCQYSSYPFLLKKSNINDRLFEDIIFLEVHMAEKNVKKKNKKGMNTDTITVLCIFSIIIILAIVVSCIHFSSKTSINGTSSQKHIEKEENASKEIIIVVGGISVIIVATYIGIKIRNRNKRKRLLLEKQRKIKEIEEARKRVEASKYSAILEAGNSVLKERADTQRILESQKTSIRHKYNFDEIDKELNSLEYNDDSEIRENNKRRHNLYNNYNDYEEYDDLEDVGDEESADKDKFSNKSLLFGILIATVVIVCAIIAGIFML